MTAMLYTQIAQRPGASAGGSYGRREQDERVPIDQASRLAPPEALLLRNAGDGLGTGAGKRRIQAKRTVSASDDAFEREADSVADHVVRMPESNDGPRHAASASASIHRLATRNNAGLVAPPIADRVLSDHGQPLESPTRAFFEPRFGHDFGHVRIHADERAAASARAIGAHAYTAGRDIVFGHGRYAPQSGEGRALLAHELTHVVQQSSATGAAGMRTIQRKAAPDADQENVSPELVQELKTKHGGQEATLPLTPDVVAWVAALRSGDTNPDEANPEAEVSPTDPRHFPEKRHSGEAFQWGDLDLRAADISDVQQGYLGDCYFMALLAAIATTRPEVIERMVQPNDDGTFTVSFFGPDGKQIKQIVEPTFPSNKGDGNPTYAQFGDESDAFPKELWPMLIEKAWMQAKGGWMKIRGSKTTTKEHAIAMTGSDAEAVALPGKLTDEALLARLSEQFAAKQPVTFFSPKTPEGKKDKSKISGVHANHTYALWDVKKSAKTADLYNPWGSEHVLDKSMAFLRSHFRHVVFFKLSGTGPKATTSGPTKEEQVAKETVPQEILKGSGYDVVVQEFERDIQTRTSQWSVRDAVQQHGEQLWKRSIERAQDAAAANADDRPLYWARLRSAAILRAFVPSRFQLTPVEKQLLLDILEAASRGRMDIVFPDRKPEDGERRVLISGFDPFGFQSGESRRTANPSGAAVLALDGRTVPAASGGNIGRVEGVIFPVRFADFDRGMVETTFRPYLAKGKQSVDMIMTISQGGSTLDPKAAEAKQSEAFELERYAGRRRSTAAPDNAAVQAVKRGELKEGKGMSAGPEFLESSLPRKEMVGREETRQEAEKTTVDGKAELGSGGGYLSNEIFYRTALLRQDEKSSVPVGHLHVPKPPPSTGTPESEAASKGLRDLIIQWVKKLIAAALATMGKKT